MDSGFSMLLRADKKSGLMSHSLRRHGRDTNIRSGLPPADETTPASDPPESRSTGQILYRRLHEQPRVTWSRTDPERHFAPAFSLTPRAAAKAVPRLRQYSCRLLLSVRMHAHPARSRKSLRKRQKSKLLIGLTIEIRPREVKPQRSIHSSMRSSLRVARRGSPANSLLRSESMHRRVFLSRRFLGTSKRRGL